MRHLYEILDRRNYLRLVNELGGTRIWIPKIGNLGHRDKKYFILRNARIKNLYNRGKNIVEIAEQYGLSRKRVYSIVKTIEEKQELSRQRMTAV